MSKKIVFGGWAVSPDILKNVFGDDACYIDVNKIMPKIFDTSCRLKDDWTEIVIAECQLKYGNIDILAGWSTGAMFAYTIARTCTHPPKKLIFLSATPCFCRKDDFRFGTRAAVLEQMIGALSNDRDTVLQSFYERCGLGYDPDIIPDYTIHELSCGLQFLKQADLRPITPLSTKPIFYHGQNDLIIPISASKYFSEKTNGSYIEITGGHAFFTCSTLQ